MLELKATNFRPIKVAVAPPVPWRGGWDAYRSGSGPDPLAVFREMRLHGVEMTLVDPSAFTQRLTRGLPSLYTGFDPIRGLELLVNFRRFDMVLTVLEAGAVVPLMLRKLVSFKAKIAMWDLVPTQTWLPRLMMQRATFPRVDHFFVLSEYHAAYLHEHYNRTNATVIGHSVDSGFYVPGIWNPDGPLVVIGDDSGRDFETLLEAVSDLDIDVIFRTSKAPQRRPGRARITHISNRISFIELRALYGSASICVVPLHRTLNCSGVSSMLEAMAMGVPLIVSENPPISDFYVADATAVVVPPNDPASLRDAIVALRAAPARASALAAEARLMVEAKFSNEAFAARFAAAISRVVQPTPQ